MVTLLTRFSDRSGNENHLKAPPKMHPRTGQDSGSRAFAHEDGFDRVEDD
jgi:hypothetical protein